MKPSRQPPGPSAFEWGNLSKVRNEQDALLTLTALNIYPLKSARGISLQSHEVVERGFLFDRQWMLVGEDGGFRTQRELPRMALLETSLVGGAAPGEWVVTAPGHGRLVLPLVLRPNEARIDVRVWRDTVAAIPVSEEANAWFSSFLQESLRLVAMPQSTRRPVNRDYSSGDEVVGFADGFPFLLISEGSLAALNERLEHPVPMSRFRPNLVVSGCEPFAEDGWRKIRIGSLELDLVKPCPRCVITTVDATTGKPAKEPLATLAKFRSRPGLGVLFGQNAIHRGVGRLDVGAPISVLEKQ
jgi:uncharacterized protein